MTEKPLSEFIWKSPNELNNHIPANKVKQAIQKTLKEIKNKLNLLDNNVANVDEFIELLDTTFKQNFGDALCH